MLFVNIKNLNKENLSFQMELYNIIKKTLVATFGEGKESNFVNPLFAFQLGVIECAEDLELFLKMIDLKREEWSFYERLIASEGVPPFLLNLTNEYRNKAVEDELRRDKPTLVDLFCGAGGFSCGFNREGFRTILANDILEVCTNTYKINHPEVESSKIINEDIRVLVENIEVYINEDVDVLIGGPPCQSFSTANRQRVIDDSRNVLYKYYVKAVEVTQPKFFVMENVKGMEKVAEQVLEDFSVIGYKVERRLLNSKNFSVPQNRERLIFIGTRLDIDVNLIFEELINGNYPTYVLKDALAGLKPLEASRVKNATNLENDNIGYDVSIVVNEVNDYIELINDGKVDPLVFNHKARYNNDRDIEIFGRMLQGDKSDSPRISDIMPYKSREHIFKDKYFKLIEEKHCKTITAHMKFDCNMYIHPIQARGLTAREAARVQSYPDGYYFSGAFTLKYMQVGNSVPPLMANAIAKVLKKKLPKKE